MNRPDSDGGDAFVISCDDCVMQHTEHCRDCVVSFFGDEPSAQPVVVEAGEAKIVDLLIGAGLVPGLRQVPRTRSPRDERARMLRSR